MTLKWAVIVAVLFSSSDCLKVHCLFDCIGVIHMKDLGFGEKQNPFLWEEREKQWTFE